VSRRVLDRNLFAIVAGQQILADRSVRIPA
jgi:hypothetical protein